MLKFIKHRSIQDFYEFNKQFWRDHMNCFGPTWELLASLQNRTDYQFEGFNIIDDEQDIFVYTFVLDYSLLLIHGFNWNEDVVKIVSEKLKIKTVPKGLIISGYKPLVLAILKSNDIDYTEIKSRIFYSCEELNKEADPEESLGYFENARFEDLEVLSTMSLQFQKEEFPNEPPKSLQQIVANLIASLKESSVYVWINNNEIKSMIQILESEDLPRIGHYFTNISDRNKGYGKALLYGVTKMVLEAVPSISLESIEDYAPSNKAFLKVGYKPIYNTLKVEIN